MKIEHIAIWVDNLERMKSFYETYFEGKAGGKYHNPDKNFTSYFLSFDNGCRLELMNNPDISSAGHNRGVQQTGYAHFAISVGSKHNVDRLTTKLGADGHKVIGEPRTTGDGYYESVILDPENNRVEITI